MTKTQIENKYGVKLESVWVLVGGKASRHMYAMRVGGKNGRLVVVGTTLRDVQKYLDE